jgi:rhodanese-related sulfurtransferase
MHCSSTTLVFSFDEGGDFITATENERAVACIRHVSKENVMASSVREMLAEANAAVPRLSPAEVQDLIGKGNALIVDVRDAPELAAGGKLKGALHSSRGMLEFRADPESPYHNPAFQKDKIVLVYCASGGRSALSGKTLKDLGYPSVYNAGGFKELTDAGLDTEPA